MAAAADGYGSHPDAGSPEAAFGHDFYLTRQGHGCGFWDRKELDAPIRICYGGSLPDDSLGDALTKLCDDSETYPEFYRGWLYFPELREVAA
jgi:hypothetical protein